MNRYKIFTWFTKPWNMGLSVFLILTSSCFFAAWLLNDYKNLHITIPGALPVLLLCITAVIVIMYVSSPLRFQKTILNRLAASDKNEKRNQAIVDALPDMIFIVDRDGHYIDFSSPNGHQPIVSPEQFILKRVSAILPGPLAAEVMTYIEKVLVTGEMINHGYQLEVEKEIRSYESRYVPHGNDSVMILVRDTTEAKIAEQRIRESEHKYRMLVEQATDSIFIANFQGNFLVVNPAGCNISQYTEEELLKMRFHDLAVADELKVIPFKLVEVASGKTVTSERKMRKKDGEIVDVEIAARIIAPNRFLAFVRDITERKKAENDLIRSKEHLRQLNIYIESIREAERLNVSKEIHDELGQQLAALKMDLSRLGKRMATIEDGLGNKIIELLDPINKMMEAVRKISSQLRPGMLDDIGLMATLDWYCEDFTKRTGIKASFAYDISDDEFSKEFNVGIFRIFQESLINVTNDSAATKVDVSIRSRDQQLVLLIEDDGKGFDPFGDQQKILVLGVMIERARMLNGSYNVNCSPGKGTTVEVCVPLSNPI